jgi:hypothetical protein
MSRFGHTTITVRFARCCSAPDSHVLPVRWGALVELGAYSGPWPVPKMLQRHHTAGKSYPPSTSPPGTLFDPAVLGLFPPAREDVHTARSVVDGPCRANMLAPCLFAAYSMLRRLTCTGWPCWRSRFAVLIRLLIPFARQQASSQQRDGRTRHSGPRSCTHKC